MGGNTNRIRPKKHFPGHIFIESVIYNHTISLKTDPKWYQYLPEHWVLEADLKGEDHLRYYTWVPKVEDRQDGKWFREIDPEEVPYDIGFWDGMRRAAILAVIALAIIGLLIVRPIVKALEKNK